LTCQGSNLDSSDPESDVLPITPQVSFRTAKIQKVLEIELFAEESSAGCGFEILFALI
jgi:hypothetical protein